MENIPQQPPVFVDVVDGFPIEYQTAGSVGGDLRAAEDVVVSVGQVTSVRCGLTLCLPRGVEAQVRSRSGLASRGIIVANAPGTIDSDYRGEVRVLMTKLFGDPVPFERGDRIAQIVFATVHTPVAKRGIIRRDLERGAAGFGSTGIS